MRESMVSDLLQGQGDVNMRLVIVDKPFAVSSEEADRVIKLGEEKGLILTCFQNRRWVSSLRLVSSKSDSNPVIGCRLSDPSPSHQQRCTGRYQRSRVAL